MRDRAQELLEVVKNAVAQAHEESAARMEAGAEGMDVDADASIPSVTQGEGEVVVTAIPNLWKRGSTAGRFSNPIPRWKSSPKV